MTDQSLYFPFRADGQAEQERLQYAIEAARAGTWNLDVAQQEVG